MVKKNYKFSIVIPILNEANNLEKLVKQISKHLSRVVHEIIFVDDNSSDNTVSILKKITKKNKAITYYIRKKNPDLSRSCILGFEKAIFENIVVMDGDLQHDPKYLIQMINLFKNDNLDFVVGSRDFTKSSIKGLSKPRFYASKILINIFFLLVGKKTIDPMSGFFVFKKNVYKKNKKRLYAKGYKILSDLIYASKYKLKIEDFVITFNLRKKGTSKMNLKVLFNILYFIGYNYIRKLI